MRIDHLFKIFIYTPSLTFCQNFVPETGQKIEPAFDPNTEIFLNSISLQSINVILKDGISFDQNYFKQTVYRKDGFWGPYYIENGKRISTKSLLGKFDIYGSSKKINRQIKKNKNLLF